MVQEAAVGVIGASLVMSHGETSVALFGVVRINLPEGMQGVCARRMSPFP